MLIPSRNVEASSKPSSLSRRVNANSQRSQLLLNRLNKLIKKGEC